MTIYFKVRKNWFPQPVGARKKCFPTIWKWKKLVPSYFKPDKHCCSYLKREKSGSLLFGDQKMQFTTVRSKEKDYDIYLKSEKLVHSQQQYEKSDFQLFGSVKKLVFSYFEPDKHCCSYLEREKKWIPAIWRPKKCSSQLLGARKKDYDIYLKSEKLVHSQQDHEKNVSRLLGSGKKTGFLAITSLTNTVCSYFE